MKREDIISNIIKNRSDEEILTLCSSEITAHFNVMMRELPKKNYELVAAALGEVGIYIDILKQYRDKKTGAKKEVIVA